MFENRLKAALYGISAVFVVLLVRLIDLQVVRGDHFRQESERALLRKPRMLPASRGRILDRQGEVLVQDEPSWEVRVDFEVIAADVGSDATQFSRMVKRLRRAGRYPHAQSPTETEAALRAELAAMWRRVASIASNTEFGDPEVLRAEAKQIYDRVHRIRQIVARRRGFDSPVAEEQTAHAVLTGLSAEQHIEALERLADFPWVRVEASMKRQYAENAEPFAHVLGRLGRVDAAEIAADPHAEDPFARYLPDDLFGIAGVEAASEKALRGRRGTLTLTPDGTSIENLVEPEPGKDVRLTLHASLQRTLYLLLGNRVRAIPESSGGAIVVLDVATREVLALVSYPSYDPARFDELFATLRDDTERSPLRFRAVANRYAPGSIVKPLVCLAGLANGRLGLHSTEHCNGYLLPEDTNHWRCWEMRGTTTRMAHGDVDVVAALTGSCNIYMYRLGERLGVDSLCSSFDMVGLGKLAGTGLPEETPGINPTPGWLMQERRSAVYPAHARLFAIGQGELSVTPLQAANLTACYANRRYRKVSIIRGDNEGQAEWILPGSAEAWDAVRQGIFGVVNHPQGTAHRYAHFVNDRFALCGKTGSATAQSWPTAYRIPFTDSVGNPGTATIPSGAKGPALKRFDEEFPGATYDPAKVSVASTWPRNADPKTDYAHAWFAGYLQRINDQGQPIWSETPRMAFAIMVEFGGSGGVTSGPIARELAETLLQVLGPNLDPDL